MLRRDDLDALNENVMPHESIHGVLGGGLNNNGETSQIGGICH